MRFRSRPAGCAPPVRAPASGAPPAGTPTPSRRVRRRATAREGDGSRHKDPILAGFAERAEPGRKLPAMTGETEIRFDDRGLVACVVQDWGTGEVLTLAYMNEEALRRTRETGETHFYSRSRDEPWHKGETSGNTQRVRQLRFDCDADALVALVDPAGPACHTGERTCFHRDLDGGEQPEPASYEALAELSRT